MEFTIYFSSNTLQPHYNTVVYSIGYNTVEAWLPLPILLRYKTLIITLICYNTDFTKDHKISVIQGRHFNFFLGGPIFYLFFNATGLLKNWKKQHFICSNLTLFIVSFFLFSLFSLFFLFLLFFFLFFLFFSFFFFLGGRRPPAPLNDASGVIVWFQCMFFFFTW